MSFTILLKSCTLSSLRASTSEGCVGGGRGSPHDAMRYMTCLGGGTGACILMGVYPDAPHRLVVVWFQKAPM